MELDARRFVVLRHEVAPGDVHFDLMVEDGDTLVTWKLPAPPPTGAGGAVEGRRSFDHRPTYLDHEGPISGGRGSVTAWDRGVAADVTGTPRRGPWRARLAGARLAGEVIVETGEREGDPARVTAGPDPLEMRTSGVLDARPNGHEEDDAMTDSATAAGSIPKIGEPAPEFTAMTTQGEITFGTWAAGSWVIRFSHPADFTPVCSTELTEFARRQADFDKRGVKLIGLSIDSIHSHIAWRENLQKIFDTRIGYPMIADSSMAVATKYGMIHPGASATATVRAVFVIDPKRTIRAIIYYPMNVGRNIDEIIRLVDGLQTADKHGVACPVNWKPGDKVIVPPPKTEKDVADRKAAKDYEVFDVYLMKKSI